MTFVSLILSFVRILIAVNLIHYSSALSCCDAGIFIVSNSYGRQCENGKSLSMNCTSRYNMLNNAWSQFSHYMVRTDKKGEYLDAFGLGYIARNPYFCTGSLKIGQGEENIQDVAFVCYHNKIFYLDIIDEDRPPPPPASERVLPIVYEVLNLLSFVTLAVAAFIYGFLRDLQDSQGICTFHFIFVTSLLHGAFFYLLVFDTENPLPDLCITNLYLPIYVLVSSFTWNAIMGYNSWTHVKNVQHIIDEDVLLKRYRHIGYGLPCFVILIGNIYAHANKLYAEFRLETDCYSHQTGILFFAIAIPIFVAFSANCFFFVDMQKLLWNSPALELRAEKSTLRKLKYRLSLNGKLFFLMGMPWLALSILIGSYNILKLTSKFWEYSLDLLFILVSGQGISIFLVLVFFRKRVLKGVSRTWLTQYNIFPARWRNVVDSETTEDDVDGTIGQSLAFEKENATFRETNDKTSPNVGALFS